MRMLRKIGHWLEGSRFARYGFNFKKASPDPAIGYWAWTSGQLSLHNRQSVVTD
jgi:hypothetical protein